MKTTQEWNSIRGFRQIYMCRSFKDIPKRYKVTFTLLALNNSNKREITPIKREITPIKGK
jgi:hypothetical protein